MINFPPKDRQLSIFVGEVEYQAVTKLAAEKEMSFDGIILAALRVYQLISLRVSEGETMSFSGDRRRQREFAGPLYDEQHQDFLKTLDWPDLPFKVLPIPSCPFYVATSNGELMALTPSPFDHTRAKFIADACNEKLENMK